MASTAQLMLHALSLCFCFVGLFLPAIVLALAIPLPDSDAPNALLIVIVLASAAVLATLAISCCTAAKGFFDRTIEPIALIVPLAVSYRQIYAVYYVSRSISWRGSSCSIARPGWFARPGITNS